MASCLSSLYVPTGSKWRMNLVWQQISGDPDSFQNKDDAAESTLAMSGGRANSELPWFTGKRPL